MNQSTITNQKNSTSSGYSRQFDLLKESHIKLNILGVPNKDQRELEKGWATFNYFNEDELNRAQQLFLSIGVESIKREDKNNNLYFALQYFRTIPVSKAPVQKRVFESNLHIPIFIWLVKKVLRKSFFTEPVDAEFFSKPARIKMLFHEFEEIKLDMEKRYDIVCLAAMNDIKHVDVWILKSEEARVTYCMYRQLGDFSIVKLSGILSDPEKLKQIRSGIERDNLKVDMRRPFKSKVDKIRNKMVKKETVEKNALAAEVRKAIRQSGICKLKSDKPLLKREMYMQIFVIAVDKVKITVSNRTEKQRVKTIKRLEVYLRKTYPQAAVVEIITEQQTQLSVSISGFLNQSFVNKKSTALVRKEKREMQKKLNLWIKQLPEEMHRQFLEFMGAGLFGIDEATAVEILSKGFSFVPKKKYLKASLFAKPEKLVKFIERNK
ncbi:MAG: hypothetical protein NTW62_01030 [Candidatus Nomurabacteria bacterium]|nr:hypothetical protein [Candidatus Nomurabacteria bacterium]